MPCPGEGEQQQHLYIAKQKTIWDHIQPLDL